MRTTRVSLCGCSGQSNLAQMVRVAWSPWMPHSSARARTMSSPWCRVGSIIPWFQGPPLSSTSIRAQRSGLTVARTVKVPPGRRDRLCWAAFAASSEAQRIASSALGQSWNTARRSARITRTWSVPPGYVTSVERGPSVLGAGVCNGSSLRRLVRTFRYLKRTFSHSNVL